MGAGIAIVAARAGFNTIVYDTAPTRSSGRASRPKRFSRNRSSAKSSRRSRSTRSSAACPARPRSPTSAECDIVIEAVFEDLKVKHDAARGAARGLPAAHDLRLEHLDAFDHRDRRGLRPRRPVRRHALLPAGAADEAGRDVAGPQHQRGDVRDRLGTAARPWARRRSGPRTIRASSSTTCWSRSTTTRSAWSRPGVAAPADIDRAIKTGLGYAMGPLRAARPGRARHAPAGVRGVVPRHPRSARRGAGVGPAHDRRRPPRPQDRPGFYSYDGNAMFGG